MKKLLIDDKEMKTINQMKAAHDLVGEIMDDLRWENNVSHEDEIIKHINLALREFEIGMSLFIAENLMDYDEWVKDNNAQIKKKKT